MHGGGSLQCAQCSAKVTSELTQRKGGGGSYVDIPEKHTLGRGTVCKGPGVVCLVCLRSKEGEDTQIHLANQSGEQGLLNLL